jgi:hypothetical protein
LIIKQPDVEYGLRLLHDSEEREKLIPELEKEIPRLLNFLNNFIEKEFQSFRPNEPLAGWFRNSYLKLIYFALAVLRHANGWLIDFEDNDFQKLTKIYEEIHSDNLLHKLVNREKGKLKWISTNFFINELSCLLNEYTLPESKLKDFIWFVLNSIIENIQSGDRLLKNFYKK